MLRPALPALGYVVHGGPVPATAARAALQESFFKLPFELSASVDALVKAGMEKLKESTLISAAPSAGQDDSSDDEQVCLVGPKLKPTLWVCLFVCLLPARRAPDRSCRHCGELRKRRLWLRGPPAV